MSRTNNFFKMLFSIVLMLSIILVNASVAFADDGTPPAETPTTVPTEEVVGTEPVTPEETPVPEEQAPAEEEASDPALFELLPENTEVVVLDENGVSIPLVSEDALNAILEDDPMWCPAGVLPGGAGCWNFTGSSGITNLLTDMRNNTNRYDENGIIYFTANPGNGAFILTDAGTSLGGDYSALRNFNITLQGGWNGTNGAGATFTGQTNFGTNYVAVGTSSNPWLGTVTINNITVDGHTSGSNSSVAVFTANNGAVNLNNILVDDADNNESVEVVTSNGSINLNNVNITDGDDNYGISLTTSNSAVNLVNVSVDNHTDSDGIRINANNGNVTLNDVDVTDGDDGNGINITTTGGNVNVGNGSLVDNQSDGDGIRIVTGSGNVFFNGFDADDQLRGDSIDVTTNSGDITLSNVDVTDQQEGYTARLVSQSGDILVNNGSDFEGDNINNGFSASTTNGTITITGTSVNPITFMDAYGCFTFFGFCLVPTLVNYNGVTLSAPTVSLNYVLANNNDLNGIYISNANTVILNNVTARDNGSDMLTQPDSGDVGSGVYVSGTGSTAVNITGGTFTGNERYGIEVVNGSIVIVSYSTCSSNDLGCLFDSVPPVLSLPANMMVEATDASGASVSYSATATDNIDGSLLVTCNPASPHVFGLGTTTVNCSATDSNNHTTSGSFTVTVRDTTPPTLTVPGDMTVEATGPSGANVTFSASATDLVDASVTLTCSPASGNPFPLDATTPVNCTATDDAGNSTSGSFNVTVRDTTPPVIASVGDIINKTDNPQGTTVTYTPPATSDLVDGAGVATCTPISGEGFPIGTSVVTCTAVDSHGNAAAPVTFTVTLKLKNNGITGTSSGGFLITVTDGQLIDLECNSILNAFGIKVAFYNLCGHQTVIDEILANTLPAGIPNGYAFVKGLNISVMSDGETIKELPHTGGIGLDFPITDNSQDQYAVLVWDDENKTWLDVTQTMKDADLSTMLSTEAEDELYQILPTDLTKALYRILSTDKAGTFVIVKK